MIDINGPRRLLLNVPAFKLYLSQVAPVLFRSDSFRFADVIDSILRDKISTYETYLIRVNGDVIFKPYRDSVGVNDYALDKIASEPVPQMSGLRFQGTTPCSAGSTPLG